MATTYASADDVDFDVPFQVHADGTITDVEGVHIYAPTVYHVDDQQPPHDIEVHPGARGDRWEALTGFTGQYSYNGAVLHASEFIGGGLERHLLEHPGVYVSTAVEVLSIGDGGVEEDPEPAGWAILRYLGHDDGCRYCAAGEPMTHTYEPGETP